MVGKQFYIAELISRYLTGTLSPEEELSLKEWRESSPENEAMFNRLCESESLTWYIQEAGKYDKNEGWKRLNSKLRRLKRRQLAITWSKYAAFLFLPIIAGALLLTTFFFDGEGTVAAQLEDQAIQILPGEKKAILTLGSGETVDLRAAQDKKTLEQDGASIRIDSTTLNYQEQTSRKPAKEVYNQVDIPHGGEYSLILSDGTKVYLNSESTLRFPVQFIGSRRVVELTGEAYFEVTESKKPFIVRMRNMEVEVLGTSFNTSAYPGEDCMTTLVNGSVKVQINEGDGCVLKPSEQAYVKPGSDNLKVRKVDTALYTSWVNGKIYFRDERLEDIMKTLSRWYDIQVFYSEPSVKNLRFGCNVSRYKEITPFLELLEKTEKLKIAIKGNSITFKHNY